MSAAPAPPPKKENIDAADLLEVRARARNMDWGARAVVCSCPSAAPRLLPRLPPSQPRLFFFFRPHRCTPCRAPVIAWPLTEASSLVRTCSRLCPVGPQEDDEFEEFEQQEWTAMAEDVQDPTMWQDGWEDDEDDGDFTAQLRAELAATEGQQPVPPAAGGPPTAAMEQ